jgi:hypothetical protein
MDKTDPYAVYNELAPSTASIVWDLDYEWHDQEWMVERAHYTPVLSLPILAAQLHFLLRAPRAYLGTLFQVVARTLPSPNFLAGALYFFPKSVFFAREMRRLGVAHVHAHFANHPALAALIVHRLTGIPFSFTAHGSDLHVDQTALAWKLAGSAFAVSVSDTTASSCASGWGDGGRSQAARDPCGIDPARIERAAGSGRTLRDPRRRGAARGQAIAT